MKGEVKKVKAPREPQRKPSSEELIQKAGLRATKPRVALLTLLKKAARPMNVGELARGLRGVDQVTVYRMIDAFRNAGMVREVNLRGERARYELADDVRDHHHIVCVTCNAFEDFIGCDYQEIRRRALKGSHSFREITGHSFDLYGMCNACTHKGARGDKAREA